MDGVQVPSTLTAAQLRAAIDALILGLAEGVESIRFPDGSGFTRVDAAKAPALLRLLRAELSLLGGQPPARTPITFHRVNMRRF